ncbi:MAG: hypothetical protein ACYC5Q_12735 [Thermoleophilia bacterium]
MGEAAAAVYIRWPDTEVPEVMSGPARLREPMLAFANMVRY